MSWPSHTAGHSALCSAEVLSPFESPGTAERLLCSSLPGLLFSEPLLRLHHLALTPWWLLIIPSDFPHCSPLVSSFSLFLLPLSFSVRIALMSTCPFFTVLVPEPLIPTAVWSWPWAMPGLLLPSLSQLLLPPGSSCSLASEAPVQCASVDGSPSLCTPPPYCLEH